MKYIILIPAYQPNHELIKLLTSINNEYPTILVDDGSGKNYRDIFESAKKYAHVISYDNNMGKGYALKTGLNYIEDTYEDNYIVVTMDADGQHILKDALKLLEYVKEHPDSLAIGSRRWDKTTPIRSRIGNYITRKIFKLATHSSIYDTQSGLRAFSHQLNNYMLTNNGNRYDYEMNVLLNLNGHNIPFKEIPITTIYINNNRDSHFKTIKDSYKIYKVIYKWSKSKKKSN